MRTQDFIHQSDNKIVPVTDPDPQKIITDVDPGSQLMKDPSGSGTLRLTH
jgi:hypothetical protein